jgi:serine/threonine protein kinase
MFLVEAQYWTGKKLGRYEIGPLVGEGGMAQVYKGRHPALNRDVAVKIILTHLIDRPGFVERFQREAQLAASLRHPSIVQVYDFDSQDGFFYMVMEFIDGSTLNTRLNQLRAQHAILPLSQINDMLQPLASAIDYAHSLGMVHRDIKPGNVMFTNKGQPVLTDFGVAKIVGGATQTAVGQVVGTPMYMSPEQASGEPGDARSDIYSLGVMLFELVTGIPPFQGNTPWSIIYKQINEPLPSARIINAQLPDVVDQIIKKATAKKPEDRYQTCGEMAEALEIVVCNADTIVNASKLPAIQPEWQMTAAAQVKPERKTVRLEGLQSIYIQVLGPVGRIMDVGRFAKAMNENPTDFPLERLDELLDRIASSFRLTETDKKAQIRKSAHILLEKTK